MTILSGLTDRVLAPGDAGPGARSLVRDISTDMFGLGSREAVVSALAGADRSAFGAPAAEGDLRLALAECGFTLASGPDGLTVAAAADDVRLRTLLFAFGWSARAGFGMDSATYLAPLS